MARYVHLALVALVATALLLVAWWFQSWGALALVFVAGVGWGWYRVQVARSAAAQKFFGELGEETRLTGFQAGSPSEMPVDPKLRSGAGKPGDPPP